MISSCAPGQLRDSERTAVLNKLNEVRARHGLPAVSYDASEDGPAAEAAMYMVANKELTHTPSSSGLCYTANASRLAGSSNLDMLWTSGSSESTPSSNAILDYLIDNNVSSLGHRRWVLYPFLNKTTYGRVDGRPSGTSSMYMASVLKVIGNTSTNVSSMSNDFVAYPYGNYPKAEFGKSWFLSFSVVASKTNLNANGKSQANLDNATVSVTSGSSTLGVSEQLVDYSGYGLPNSLQWKVSGLQDNTDYTVTISNVVVNGTTRQFQYNFRLQ